MNTSSPSPLVVVEDQTLSAEALLTKAVSAGASVDTLERLLVMRRELRAEAARDAFFVALKAFQAACPAIHKTKKVLNRDGSVRYAYAPLEDIVAAVAKLCAPKSAM